MTDLRIVADQMQEIYFSATFYRVIDASGETIAFFDEEEDADLFVLAKRQRDSLAEHSHPGTGQ